MKTFLFDFTNFGIVYVNENTNNPMRWQLSILRSCLLDTGIARVFSFNPFYKELTNVALGDKFYFLDRPRGVAIGNQHEVNEYFLEKQRRAKLMMPLIDLLVNAVSSRSFSELNDFGIPMDDTIAIELMNSNPNTNEYSPGVIEYATMLSITPAQAYQELQLDYKTHHAVKMKTYATTKKYINLIRAVRTTEQANALLENINQKLFKDTYI